jgi:hypothetical protein
MKSSLPAMLIRFGIYVKALALDYFRLGSVHPLCCLRTPGIVRDSTPTRGDILVLPSGLPKTSHFGNDNSPNPAVYFQCPTPHGAEGFLAGSSRDSPIAQKPTLRPDPKFLKQDGGIGNSPLPRNTCISAISHVLKLRQLKNPCAKAVF